MRVAIIGGGVAGLATAWLSKDCADIVLYERDASLGGHARSIPIEKDGAVVNAEDGFWFAGMYVTDVDTHESALVSALAAARKLAPGSVNQRRLPDGGRGSRFAAS